MLFLSLVVMITLGSLLVRSCLRIEGNSGTTNSRKTVRAYVDGKPVHSYVQE